MVNSLHEMGRRSGDLWSKVDAIQKIMKKFFKFQIEEEDMKNQITQVVKLSLFFVYKFPVKEHFLCTTGFWWN